MKCVNFVELDRLSFRNKVVVILEVPKKGLNIEHSSYASFTFNYNDISLLFLTLSNYQIKVSNKTGKNLHFMLKRLIKKSVIIFPYGVILTPC